MATEVNLHVFRARNLFPVNRDGRTSDPRCSVTATAAKTSSSETTQTVYRTQVIRKDLNPTWNRVFTIPRSSILEFVVEDKEKSSILGTTSYQFMGKSHKLTVEELIKGGEQWIHLHHDSDASRSIGSILVKIDTGDSTGTAADMEKIEANAIQRMSIGEYGNRVFIASNYGLMDSGDIAISTVLVSLNTIANKWVNDHRSQIKVVSVNCVEQNSADSSDLSLIVFYQRTSNNASN